MSVVEVLERGFELACPDRGRFRFYLKTAVRRFALAWLWKQRPTVDVAFLHDALVDDQSDSGRVLRDRFRRRRLVSTQVGRAIRADAFRKQLSRGRQRFAELLLEELYQTVDRDDPAAVEEELRDLGLISYIRDYIPLTS